MPASQQRNNKHTDRNAIIVAVGSELLQGQILNRNAQWISEKLFEKGINVISHHTVDDEHQDILDVLNLAAERAEWIFVTGGLGPTGDDLTRHAIASWNGVDLEYDEGSWQHILEIFERSGRDTPETNRQQCQFPKGSRVLHNRNGTANGFFCEKGDRSLWALPGPPREISAIWDDHIASQIESRIQSWHASNGIAAGDRPRLWRWRTIGIGESHLAELLAHALKKHHVDDNELAYRAHAPYVELKLRCKTSQNPANTPLLADIQEVVEPFLFETNEENWISQLRDKLATFDSVHICDAATHGKIIDALNLAGLHGQIRNSRIELDQPTKGNPLERIKALHAKSRRTSEPSHQAWLGLAGFSETWDFAVGWAFPSNETDLKVTQVRSPYASAKLQDRNRLAVAAVAAKTICQQTPS